MKVQEKVFLRNFGKDVTFGEKNSFINRVRKYAEKNEP